MELNYAIDNEFVTIFDSYLVKDSKEMNEIIDKIRLENPNNPFLLQVSSNKKMIQEWEAHNFLYEMGLYEIHTKDVDLNKNDKTTEIIYFTLSIMYKIKRFLKK